MAEVALSEVLSAPPSTEAERWRLIVRPLGQVALLEDEALEATPKDDPNLHALDLLSRGRDELAAHLNILPEDLTKERIDEELGNILQRYNARTIPQAFCRAVDAGDILVPVLEQANEREYGRRARGILRGIANGQTSLKIRVAQGLTTELFDDVCSRLRAQLGAQPSFVSFMRRAYELGLRKAAPKQTAPLVDTYAFSLPDHEPVQLTKAMIRAIEGRSTGLTSEETGTKQGISENTVKTHLRRLFHRIEALDAAEATTKTIVLGRLAIEAQPMIKNALSEKETAVLIEAAQGLSNEEIGTKLFISENTVKTHISRAMAKLGAKGREHAVRRMFEIGVFRVDTGTQTPDQTN